MGLCALCGHQTLDGGTLCGFHVAREPDKWAAWNRVMCDFLHRGIEPPPSELGDDFASHSAALDEVLVP